MPVFCPDENVWMPEDDYDFDNPNEELDDCWREIAEGKHIIVNTQVDINDDDDLPF